MAAAPPNATTHSLFTKPTSRLQCYIAMCDFHRTHFLFQLLVFFFLLSTSLLLIPSILIAVGFIIGFFHSFPVPTVFICAAYLLGVGERLLIFLGLWDAAAAPE